MTRMTERARNPGFRRTLIASAFGVAALSAAAAPALADTLGYYQDGPPVVVTTPGSTTTTTTYTYTYTDPPYPPPAFGYVPERGPGIYLDTPILNFGIGFH